MIQHDGTKNEPMLARTPGQSIADISHELTQPLTTLHCCLELVLRKMPRSSKCRADLQIALGEAEKLTELVGQLRELASADHDEKQCASEPSREPAPPLAWPSRCCR